MPYPDGTPPAQINSGFAAAAVHKPTPSAYAKGMNTKITAAILAALLFFICPLAVLSAPGTTPAKPTGKPTVSARAAILLSPQTGRVLFEKNADQRLPMASTTKIMTALVVLEKLPPERMVTVKKEACGVEGSSLYLQPGEQLTVRQLLEGLMLRSANDAAEMLALETAGSIEAFAALMNEKAAALGAVNTHFENPHGLDGKEHYTTARDLAQIAAAAMKAELFREIVGQRSVKMPAPDGGVRVVANHNKLLYLYEGACGIKTGFTKKCGRCLVGAAEREGVELISVTLSASDDWNDHKKLFDYGFSGLENKRLAEKGECLSETDIPGRESPVKLLAEKEVRLVLPRGAEVKTEIEIRRPLHPVAPGTVLGKAHFCLDGKRIASVRLVSA